MIQRFYDPASGAVLIGQERRALNQLNIRRARLCFGADRY